MHPLIDAWRRFQPIPPFVLAGDEVVLEHRNLVARFDSWEAYIAESDFGRPATPELHVGLLPMPFVGDLATAKVFLLMLNPGLAPSDYFGEYTVPSYQKDLLRNLRQERVPSFLFLEPQYSWHGGYLYWQGKLRQLIDELAACRSIPFGAARHFLQKRLATIELIPYHSRYMKFPDRVLSSLASVALVKSFVQDQLVPSRARWSVLNRCDAGSGSMGSARAQASEHHQVFGYRGEKRPPFAQVSMCDRGISSRRRDCGLTSPSRSLSEAKTHLCCSEGRSVSLFLVVRKAVVVATTCIAFTTAGCITSPMGTLPQPVSGEPNTFKFKLFINAFVGGDTADERIVSHLEDFRTQRGYARYKILNRQFNSMPSSYEYIVRYE
jgi:hypothetical protein